MELQGFGFSFYLFSSIVSKLNPSYDETKRCSIHQTCNINPLNAELHPISHLLALLGAHHIFHVSELMLNVPFGMTMIF
jgi:hypothetical protein